MTKKIICLALPALAAMAATSFEGGFVERKPMMYAGIPLENFTDTAKDSFSFDEFKDRSARGRGTITILANNSRKKRNFNLNTFSVVDGIGNGGGNTQVTPSKDEEKKYAKADASNIDVDKFITKLTSNKNGKLVTYEQVKEGLNSVMGVAKTHNTSVAGDNISITNHTNSNGGVEYTINTKNDVTFDKVSVGNVIIDKTKNKITGVEAGEISATSKDAINGSQLFTTQKELDSKVDDIDDKLSGAIASSVAIVDAPYRNGNWSYGIGLGYYSKAKALGGTIRRTSDDGRWSFILGASIADKSNAMGKLGITGEF